MAEGADVVEVDVQFVAQFVAIHVGADEVDTRAAVVDVVHVGVDGEVDRVREGASAEVDGVACVEGVGAVAFVYGSVREERAIGMLELESGCTRENANRIFCGRWNCEMSTPDYRICTKLSKSSIGT